MSGKWILYSENAHYTIQKSLKYAFAINIVIIMSTKYAFVMEACHFNQLSNGQAQNQSLLYANPSIS